jgi:hypothetical protein
MPPGFEDRRILPDSTVEGAACKCHTSVEELRMPIFKFVRFIE